MSGLHLKARTLVRFTPLFKKHTQDKQILLVMVPSAPTPHTFVILSIFLNVLPYRYYCRYYSVDLPGLHALLDGFPRSLVVAVVGKTVQLILVLEPDVPTNQQEHYKSNMSCTAEELYTKPRLVETSELFTPSYSTDVQSAIQMSLEIGTN